MDDRPVQEVSLENPVLLVYFGALVLASLLCCARLLAQWRNPVTRRLRINPWQISWIDFGIFVWIAFCWTFLSQALVGFLPGHAPEANGPHSPATVLLIGTVMQGGLILFFLLYRVFFWQLFQAPVNAHALPIAPAARKGLFYFLGFFPIIWAVGLLWMLIASWLGRQGISLPMESQEIVDYFQATRETVLLIGLVLLATVLAPLAEELIFRAGIYRFLKSRFRVFPAMLVSSVLFSFAHMNVMSFPSLVAVGIFLCLAYEWSGSIKVPIFLHAFFNLNSIILILLQT